MEEQHKNTDSVFRGKVVELIDNLKGVCASYGLGNDGNEYKIIIQVFLYKFLNDKFAHEVKKIDTELVQAKKWESVLDKYSDTQYKKLLAKLSPNTARLQRNQLISYLSNRVEQKGYNPEAQKDDEKGIAQLFDDALMDIAANRTNHKLFSVKTSGESKIVLFEKISNYITDESRRDMFCKALISRLAEFSFENSLEDKFTQKYDFYATIFEYLISDYNKDGGGKYAEYYTPHAVARIIAAILVPNKTQNVSCYDPAAGSGTLLMSLAHQIGEKRCTIYAQDVSQKSSSMLRLNLILNNLVHSIPNIIQGNTMTNPYFKEGKHLQKFDYIVSNPPFKLDFSDFREHLEGKENNERFFAGIPNEPKKAKDKMAIYTLFLQHIVYSLNEKGKAAMVVPTGFITAQSGINKKIRKKIVDSKMLSGVVSMPSNIFATTGTNVSILFLDKGNTDGKVVLMDASNLGKKVKEGKNQKTVLSPVEEQKIIDTFNQQETVDDFTVVVDYADIKAKNYSLSAGQYFEVKIDYVDITQEEFAAKMKGFTSNLDGLFAESKVLEQEIKENLKELKYK